VGDVLWVGVYVLCFVLVRRKRDGKVFNVEVKTGKAKRKRSQVAKDKEMAKGETTTYTGKRAEERKLDTDRPTGPIETVEARPKIPKLEE